MRRREWGLWSWSEGLSGGPCLAGRRADRRMWWVTGTCSRSTIWPGGGLCQWCEGTCFTLCICVRILAGLRCSASYCHSAACIHEDEDSSWARDESKNRHAPDAVLLCRESVAVTQIGSESMGRVREWLWRLDNLPRWIKSRTHQKKFSLIID